MSTPLVILNRQTVLALDPLTGTERWRVPVDDLPTRLFVVGEALLVTIAAPPTVVHASGTVLALELATGRQLGRVPLPFRPTSGVVHDEHLFLAGNDGAACLTSRGQVLWMAGPKRSELLPGVTRIEGVVAHDASGRELWKVEAQNKYEECRAGIAIGDQVAQPDLR